MSTPTIEDQNLAGEPILERISANIVAALETLTTAGGAYANATVYRPSPADPADLVDYRLSVVQGNPDELEDGDTPYGMKGWIQPYSIECECVIPEGKTTPIDRVLNRVRADVENKLREDPQRGGLAVDTNIRPPDYADVAANSRTGKVTVVCEVTYRTLEDDSYRLPGE